MDPIDQLKTVCLRMLELAKNATPGPWYYDCGNYDIESRHKEHWRKTLFDVNTDHMGTCDSDALFVEHAREDAPKLAAACLAFIEIADKYRQQDWASEANKEGVIKL